MSTKKAIQGFLFPMMMYGWTEDDKESRKEQWKNFKSTMETFLDQVQEMQKTAMEARKEQWNKTFAQLMEMQDNFAANLPEEFPTLPGMPASPVTPKEVMNKVKDFQETVNKHAIEQADSRIEFIKKGQEQVKEIVTDAVKSVEEKAE
jgi:predicted transcriptional regulator